MTTPSVALNETNKIERSIVVNAPKEKVWRALADAEQFGTWFGANLSGQTFSVGQRARGQITIKGYEHVVFDVVIESLEPMSRLSYRWHPYAVDPNIDYSEEQPTLVTFTLLDAPGQGTLLTVVESGFDQLPPERRLEAFRMNDGGWKGQLDNIARHASA